MVTLLLLPVLSWAATTGKISGVVRDAGTNEPLPGVNIVVEGTMMGASTSLDGTYYIINIPPGVFRLKATMMGYQSTIKTDVLVKVDLTTHVNFSLGETILDLGESVEIVADRPIVQKDLTSGRAIVTAEEIKEMPVESFQGVLQMKAGVTTGSDGAMHIRGGRSNEVSYMIDGIAMSNPFSGGVVVQVENTGIQELQVVSGTFNAEYGQAMSGVVNIVTKEGGSKYHGNLAMYMADRISTHDDIYVNIDDINVLSQYNFDASIDGPVPGTKGKVTFFASARYFNEDGYYYGIREHNMGDVLYVDPASAANLANSPYNDGRLFFLEPFEDDNANGVFDVAEPFDDLNGNGVYDAGESFEDVDGNSYYNEAETYSDYNGNGFKDNGISGDSSYVPMNPYKRLSAQAKLTYRVTPNITLRYNLLYNDSESKYYSHFSKYVPDGIPTRYDNTVTHKVDLTHQLSRSTFYELKVAMYEDDYQRYLYKDWQDPRYLPNILRSSTPGSEFYGGGQDRRHFYRNSVTTVARFDLTSQVNNSHQVKLGGEARYHDMHQHGYSVSISETNNWVPTIYTPATSTSNDMYDRFPIELSAYFQDKIELKDMIVNIGIRYDYFDSQGQVVKDPKDTKLIAGNRESLADLERVDATPKQNISPRLGIAYPITERGTIHFSYGHFFQIPPFSYLYSNPEFEVVSGRFNSVLGNADLEPQQTVIYEIGLQQQLTNDLGVEAIMFYKDIRNWLGSEFYELYSRGDYYSRYQTLDFGNVRGVTVTLEKRRTGYFSGAVDYTYSVAEGNSSDPLSSFYDNQTVPPQETEARVVPLDWDQTHSLNFTATFSKPRDWGMSLQGRFGTGLPYTPTRDALRIDAENSERKPSQMTFDLAAHKDFYLKKNHFLSFFLKVYNLFDTLNENYVYSDTGRATYALYPSTDYGHLFGRHALNDYLTRPNYYSAPRSVRMGVNFGF
ncbi:TonB-dependent receptor [bacterium]|nr:TonB-dependent receptor [bacterium]